MSGRNVSERDASGRAIGEPGRQVVVLGIGNVLLGDDGVGIHVIRELERIASLEPSRLPAATALIDGGTLGAELLPWIAGAGAVVLVDAVDGGHAPGDVEVLRGGALLGAAAPGVPADRSGLSDLLDTARMACALPPLVALVGVQPGEIEVGLEPSAVVRAAVPRAVEAALGEIRRFGELLAPGTAPVREFEVASCGA